MQDQIAMPPINETWLNVIKLIKVKKLHNEFKSFKNQDPSS